nr:hypothetical protein [Bacteroidota bacterium]
MKMFSVYIILILLAFNLLSCTDNIELKQSDLNKYHWLAPFITVDKFEDFRGFHNIDLGTIEFSYKVSLKAKNDLFIKYDSIALTEQWETIKKNDLERIFSRKVSQDQKDGGCITINIISDTLHRRQIFKIK